MTDTDARTRTAHDVAQLAQDLGITVAVAESLTSGQIAAAIGAAPDASEWFLGAVVAYTYKVKQRVLDVPPGPVVTADAARHMAIGVRQLTGADVVVAVTGAGGPEGQDGEPPGTVFIGTNSRVRTHVTRHQFSGEAADVLAQTVQAALEALKLALAEPPSRLRTLATRPALPRKWRTRLLRHEHTTRRPRREHRLAKPGDQREAECSTYVLSALCVTVRHSDVTGDTTKLRYRVGSKTTLRQPSSFF